MLKGGETGEPAIVPGKPAESHLVEQITPQDGKAEMPQNKPPLAESEIALIAQWIAQGAIDDTPQNLGRRYDMEHPPEYTRLPVIPALAFSPDGSLLAVAGFHEVLLWKADGSELVGRLVGLSERIESLAFSPDGKKLAVTGGRPARMGEVQVWDVAKRKLAFRSRSPMTRSTARAGRPTAPRSPSAAPTTRSGRSTPRPASRSCSWARTTTGPSTRSSRSTART